MIVQQLTQLIGFLRNAEFSTKGENVPWQDFLKIDNKRKVTWMCVQGSIIHEGKQIIQYEGKLPRILYNVV